MFPSQEPSPARAPPGPSFCVAFLNLTVTSCGVTPKPVPVDWLKKEWRARGLLKRVQLTISGCLGPCDLPNVVTISNENGTQWFGEITQFEQYRDLVDWATRSQGCRRIAAPSKRISTTHASSVSQARRAAWMIC